MPNPAESICSTMLVGMGWVVEMAVVKVAVRVVEAMAVVVTAVVMAVAAMAEEVTVVVMAVAGMEVEATEAAMGVVVMAAVVTEAVMVVAREAAVREAVREVFQKRRPRSNARQAVHTPLDN